MHNLLLCPCITDRQSTPANLCGLQGGLVPSAMVIVEPRKHHLLQYVLSNFHENMPLHYDLYVFHGKSAGPFARAAVAAANVTLRRRVYYRQLEEDDMDPKEPQLGQPWLVPYNLLLRTPDFWHQIDAENILVFQTDSVLCAGSPWRIQDFEHLGYIGCGRGTEVSYTALSLFRAASFSLCPTDNLLDCPCESLAPLLHCTDVPALLLLPPLRQNSRAPPASCRRATTLPSGKRRCSGGWGVSHSARRVPPWSV